MRVNAWQCPHCGDVFLDSKAQSACTRRCLKRIKEKRVIKLKYNKAVGNPDYIRLNCDDVIFSLPCMLEDFVKENLERELEFHEWNLKFKPNIDTYHTQPMGVNIPYNVRISSEKRPTFPGWQGQVKGRCNMYNVPVQSPEGEEDRKIGGFSGLFAGFNRTPVINGIHSGSGSGGSQFQYEVTIFAQDFPLVYKYYPDYAELLKKHEASAQEVSRLNWLAEQKLVKEDPAVCRIETNQQVVHKYTKHLRKLYEQRVKDIRSSQEYADALKPSEDFDYDANRYYELSAKFPK